MTTNKIIKPILASLIVGLACSAGAADAAKSEYNYVGVRAGLVTPSTLQGNSDLKSVAPDTAYTAGIAFGRQLTERFGAEVEYTYRGKSYINSNSIINTANGTVNSSNDWAVSSNTFMVNAIANLLEGQHMVMPYLKAGMGLSDNKSYDYVYNSNNRIETWSGKSKSTFAWQAAFGLNLATSNMIDTNFEYAYIDRGKFETQGDGKVSYANGEKDTIPNTAKTGHLREQVVTIGFKVKF